MVVPTYADGTAWSETQARTCLYKPDPGPSARRSAPSYLILEGREHNGEPLTRGSMTAWSDSAPWPVAHTYIPSQSVARYEAAARMLGVRTYGSPPTEGSAHWTIPRLPK